MKYFILTVVFIGYTLPLLGQEDSLSFTLDEVTIKENRMEIPFSKSSRNIQVIHRKALETSPARSLQEILSFTPGVDVRQRGVAGVQADIGIRGGSFEQTLMLVNGIKLSDPQTGHHMVNIPVPLAGIQRIDVLKGPASRIFGQNAYAGAINVITELPETYELHAGIYGGDFGMRGGTFQLGLPLGNFKQNLAVSHDASNGHWYNSDYKVTNLFYESGLALTPSQELKAMVAFANRDFGANGFYSSSFPDQWESIQTTLAALSHTFEQDQLYIQTRAYWRQNQDEFRLRRYEPEFFQNQHSTDVVALEVNARRKLPIGTLGMGVEGRKEQIDSNNLGKRDRRLLGAFLEHRIIVGEKGDLRAGMYSNYYSEYGWKHFPGAEIGYQLRPWLRTYANVGSSFRIPTYTDLYYSGPTNIGNENLQPEKALSYEGGVKVFKEGLNAELVYFKRSTSNLIEWARPDADSPWQPQNFNEVDFQGLELGLIYTFSSSNSVLKMEEVSVSYHFIDANLVEQEGQETRYSLNALRHQLIGGIQLSYKDKLELTAKSRYIERMKLDPYFLLDIRLDFNRLKDVGFFTEVSNLSNTDYIEAGTVQMPGRWARGGLTVNFGGK
ncbi:TonB-dependent receptor plug domain-containing protein [Cyclobacterium xiamenense]|uniref:TonB-dependent receptor plug domain-containing protein n=1 Tax=Cyclobacterium xiamenense TaxID=1297121 RepID=UPI0035CF80D7